MNYIITIQGRGGHGSRPDLSYNPVDCFVAVFGSLQRFGPTITQVDGGAAVNVIPDKLIFHMECAGTPQELAQVLEPTCALYHCTFTIDTL